MLSQSDKPTAIFASNDKIAIGVMRAMKEMNLKVPKDISIIGFDDIEECKYKSTTYDDKDGLSKDGRYNY